MQASPVVGMVTSWSADAMLVDSARLGRMDILALRDAFPICRTRAYLFSGALAPAATPVRAAWDAWSDSWSLDPNAVYTGEAMMGRMDALREAFAGVIGADPGGIALTDNTCRAANIAVRIAAARPGRTNVVVDDGTYPSSVYPWRAHGTHEVRQVTTDGVADAAAVVAQAVDERTAAVCITHVAPFTGRRHDLRALADAAHGHGAWLMVDAAQSAGVVPMDVRAEGVDMLVTTGMKWLLGPPGVGYLYLAPHVLADAPVLDVGYIGLDVDLGDWPVDHVPPITPTARRYELGLPSLPALAASRAGIELLVEAGIEAVFERSASLVDRCLDGLAARSAEIVTPLPRDQRAGVIVFGHADPADLFARCRDQGVDIGVLPDRVRVDPHAFNSEEDIDRLLELV
jgi:selenocysteine lyase/cysteine desulfurase